MNKCSEEIPEHFQKLIKHEKLLFNLNKFNSKNPRTCMINFLCKDAADGKAPGFVIMSYFPILLLLFSK